MRTLPGGYGKTFEIYERSRHHSGHRKFQKKEEKYSDFHNKKKKFQNHSENIRYLIKKL